MLKQYKAILSDFILVKMFFFPIWLVYVLTDLLLRLLIDLISITQLEIILFYFEILGFISIIILEFIELEIVIFKRIKIIRDI